MRVNSWALAWRWLVRLVLVGAHLSRAFGGAPEFVSTTMSGHGIRPWVLIVITNVRVTLFLLSVR